VAGTLAQQGVLSFAVLPYLSRRFSAAEFGDVMLVFSLTNFLIAVVSTGLSMAFYRLHHDVPATQMTSFLTTSLAAATALGLLAGGSLYLAAGQLGTRWSDGSLVRPLRCASIYVATSIIFIFIRVIPMTQMRFGWATVGSAAYGVGLLAVFLVPREMLPTAWPLALSVGPAAGVLLIFGWLKIRNGFRFGTVSRHMALKLGAIGSAYGVAVMGGSLITMGDRWVMAQRLFPHEQIGFYSVAAQASLLILAPVDQLSLVLVPMLSNVRSLGDLSSRFLRNHFYLLSASILGVAILGGALGSAYMYLFYGATYFHFAIRSFLVLLGACALYPIQIFSRGILTRFSHPLVIPGVELSGGVLAVTAAWLLAVPWGVYGVAAGRAGGIALVSLAYLSICQLPLLARFLRSGISKESGEGARIPEDVG
jgi:O-antigen/teichoic acid export membrane protein